MKQIYIAGAVLLMTMLGACKKFLTETPLSQGETSGYYKSGKDMNAALTGVYSALQEQLEGDGVSKYGGNYHYWGDMRADVFNKGQYGGTTQTELASNAITTSNSSADWTGLYEVISRANYCIKYFPRIPSMDNTVTTAALNNAMAQCYALRAISYFYIIRVWGDPVVWTTPYEDLSQTTMLARSPKATVLDTLVIPDLLKAYSLITKNATPDVYKIGEAAICAILADVYMWKHSYTDAITWINNLFKAKGPTGAVYSGASGSNLEPASTWKNLFVAPYSTIESIWSINWDQTYNGCSCIPMGIGKSNSPVIVDSAFKADWRRIGKVDTRLLKSIDTLSGNNHDNLIVKYYNVAGNNIPTGSGAPDAQTYNVYLVMYRLGDIYLSYAEALNKTNDPTNALRYLNYIRVRAGLPAYNATDAAVATTDALEDAILTERRYELFAEGKRWFDLVRTNHVNKIMDPLLKLRGIAQGFGPDANKILWPLHRNVLTANKKLVQNPSY